MIAVGDKQSRNNFYLRVLEWTKLFTIVGGAKVLVQIAGLITGIIIIRSLSIQEYAIYTLANSALGMLTILSDGGISAGVLSQGSRVWRSKEKLGEVLITGLELRKKFASFALIIFIPVVSYLLLQHGAGYITVGLIIFSIIPSFYASLSDSLFQIAPKLHQDIKPLQINGIAASIGRVILIASTITFFPWAFVAIIAAGIPRIIANFKLKKIAGKHIDWNQKPNQETRKNILGTVKRLFPEQIYFCVSSQITIWLISIFGSTNSIAQIGVLSRLSMLLTIFTMIMQAIVVPRFARLQNKKRELTKWFIMIQCILLLFIFIVAIFSKIFASELLMIIGSKYVGLDSYFILAVVSALINSFTGILYSLMISRNFILHPAISISIGIVVQIFLISILNFSQLEDVYYFSIAQSIVGILSANIYFWLRMRRNKREETVHL